jgi:UDP-glucose 4-epimerase
MSKLILVTGGSGYIGTHCLVELLKDGYNVFVVDNEYNSSFESLKRVELISGKQVPFVKLNLNDKQNLNALFKANQFYAVLHLAAFKAVGESTGKPLEYYSNNVASTICLLEVFMLYSLLS